MSRMFFMTFHGKARWTDNKAQASAERPLRHPHESPWLMTVPMIILAIGSLGLGFVLQLGGGFTTWLEPVTGHVEHHEPVLSVPVIQIATLVAVAIGLVLAWRQYGALPVPTTAPKGSVLTRAARVDMYQDTVNDALLVQPGQYLTRSLVYGDRSVVDGAFTGLGKLTVGIGQVLRKLQSGYARQYAATMLIGLVVLAVVVLAPRI